MGTGRLFGLSSELWVRQRKVQDPAGKHHVVARFNSFSTVCFLGRLALPRGAAVLTVFFTFLNNHFVKNMLKMLRQV